MAHAAGLEGSSPLAGGGVQRRPACRLQGAAGRGGVMHCWQLGSLPCRVHSVRSFGNSACLGVEAAQVELPPVEPEGGLPALRQPAGSRWQGAAGGG